MKEFIEYSDEYRDHEWINHHYTTGKGNYLEKTTRVSPVEAFWMSGKNREELGEEYADRPFREKDDKKTYWFRVPKVDIEGFSHNKTVTVLSTPKAIMDWFHIYSQQTGAINLDNEIRFNYYTRIEDVESLEGFVSSD